MKSINRVILLGRLGRKPEIRHTSTGKAFSRVGLATSSRFRRGDEWVEDTEWHNIMLWEHNAQFASQYLDKGDACIIEGRLAVSSYKDANGNPRRNVDVVCERITLLPSRGRRNEAPVEESLDESPETEPSESLPPMGSSDDEGLTCGAEAPF